MAYLVEITYKDQYKELVVLWSAAKSEELRILKRYNPDILWARNITDDLTEEECIELDERRVRTIYKLPKEFRENPETVRRRKEEYERKQEEVAWTNY